MNTVNTTLRQPLLDADWIVAIQEELENNPAGVAFSIEPELCGAYDAQLGLPCDPVSRGYRKLGDVENYIVSYKEVTANWAAAVQEVNDSLCPGIDLEGELQELIDGMDDEMFWRTGGW